MKLRLMVMGVILCLLAIFLIADKGAEPAYGGLLAVGIVLFVAGIFMKSSRPVQSENTSGPV
jgi:membrane-bound ClpP family serine protease